MLLTRLIFLVFLVVTWLLMACSCVVLAAFTMINAANTSKHECQRQCGHVKVPYPFGLEKDCAMGEDYILRCDNENSPSKLVFIDTFSEILNISETQLVVTAGPAASSCKIEKQYYDKPGSLNYTTKPYAVSSKANKFVVTGCHHYGLMEAETRRGSRFLSCVALCTKEVDLHDRSCSGLGCCKAPIPKGLQKFNLNLERIIYEGSIPSGNCSYAFIVKHSDFKFQGAIDLKDPRFYDRAATFPVVMDWFVPNKTCMEAKRNSTTYACQQNSNCIDLDQALDVYGYRCECHQGYEGNPYLKPGCVDVNECARPNNPCPYFCINTNGSYDCTCPSGYRSVGIQCFPKKKYFFILGNY